MSLKREPKFNDIKPRWNFFAFQESMSPWQADNTDNTGVASCFESTWQLLEHVSISAPLETLEYTQQGCLNIELVVDGC